MSPRDIEQARATFVEPPPWTLRGEATAILYRRGILAFLRYSKSNVGPYDELLWLAPFHRGPAGRAHHVAAIFVSSEASAQSGRANWGLPKQLADFRVSPLGADSERVQVARNGRPFASFVRGRARATLPFATSWLPRQARRLVQVSAGCCFETVPSARGRCQLTRVFQLEINRELLPHARSSPQRLAIHLSPFELCFPAARIL